jgi:hypothetical protein
MCGTKSLDGSLYRCHDHFLDVLMSLMSGRDKRGEPVIYFQIQIAEGLGPLAIQSKSTTIKNVASN